MHEYPLEGLKVLDFSRVLAGPFATRMLSDLGADVLKVEPPEGDLTRQLGLKTGNMSGYYLQQNIGKRNICIDLRVEGARDLVLKLAATSDLVVENFRPGIMDKFGVGWQDLSRVNPKLVMVSISGFGQDGPERGRAAYAPIVHAETGILSRQAEAKGQTPADLALSVADTFTSLHGLVGALSALMMAQRTGKGQHVDIAMMNAVHATDDYANYALDGAWPREGENFIWEAPENSRILISGSQKWLWIVFSQRAGLSDPTPEGADLKTKIMARYHAIADHIRSFASFQALTDHLDTLNLAWGRVRDFGADSFSQPTVAARGILVEVEDETGSKRRTVQSPYKFSSARSGITPESRAPRRGEHNQSALKDWIGLSDRDVDALREAGILVAEDGL